MAIYGNDGIRTHHGTGGAAGALVSFVFDDSGGDVAFLIYVRSESNNSFGASVDAEAASFAPLGIDDDIG